MNQTVKVCLFVLLGCLLAFTVYAEDIVKDFTLKTVVGKTFDSRSLKGMPIVIIIGSHW